MENQNQEEYPQFEESNIKGAGQAKEWMMTADTLTVEDEDSESEAADILKKLNDSKKSIEAQRKEYVRPLIDEKDQIDGVFKALSNPLETAISKVKGLVLSYKKRVAEEEARIQREADKKAREDEAERLRIHQAKVAKAEEENKPVPPPPPPEPVQSAPVPTKPNVTTGKHGGKTHLKDNWVWELVDIKKVPKNFKKTIVDEEAVKAAMGYGLREIPGIEIRNDPKLVSR